MMRRSRGVCTQAQIDRCAALCGVASEDIERLFWHFVFDSREDSEAYTNDIKSVIKLLVKDEVFAVSVNVMPTLGDV
jgi:hypothetical protein